MFSPVQIDYRVLVENRMKSNSESSISITTKHSIKSFILNLINSEQRIESYRKKLKSLYSFNPKLIFESIGGKGSNFFSEKDFISYLERNKINFLNKDVELLLIRLSKNKKGLITFDQFYDEIYPRY